MNITFETAIWIWIGTCAILYLIIALKIAYDTITYNRMIRNETEKRFTAIRINTIREKTKRLEAEYQKHIQSGQQKTCPDLDDTVSLPNDSGR